MILYPPIIITPRLMPGLQIGDGFISLDCAGGDNGRVVYEVFIDAPGFEHEVTDLRSGCGGGSIQDGLASLLSFLGAAAESRRYRAHTGKIEPDSDGNETLFPPAVVDWACENADELSMLGLELDEGGQLVTK